ncbi:lytic murein transglycosylase [Microbispora bryophytorum]|uniref:Transglycosylase SLT domain-containing protein n=1 Tax=Microbispora bryophytorum subsp. camponoti TaxID=1677852 RepID=A0ABR8KWH0_9ACTN|nr:lytic murein transglycosylase [Microbispora camponoti]MBD3143114.1 transglycosylase SLT domain-containing protein [Microbispora camponoti]
MNDQPAVISPPMPQHTMPRHTMPQRTMPRRAMLAAALAAVVVPLSGCGGSVGEAASVAPRESVTAPASERSPASAERPAPAARDLPAPDEAIPKDPKRLADALSRTSGRLRDAIDDWRRTGDPAKGEAPEPVVLLSLYEQRVYRYLARHSTIASRTYGKLPEDMAARARDNVTAIRDLLSLAHPVSGPIKIKIEAPQPADALLAAFRRAERRFGVEWEVLAAVMLVETKFGRVRSPSYVGAKGPMQFMPGTWKAYGMGGDIDDTGDALLAAANYLHASGAPGDYRRALYAYNHSQAYVDAVLLHARQMKRDVRNYYAYYTWQVYVITTKGERRLTGP